MSVIKIFVYSFFFIRSRQMHQYDFWLDARLGKASSSQVYIDNHLRFHSSVFKFYFLTFNLLIQPESI